MVDESNRWNISVSVSVADAASERSRSVSGASTGLSCSPLSSPRVRPLHPSHWTHIWTFWMFVDVRVLSALRRSFERNNLEIIWGHCTFLLLHQCFDNYKHHFAKTSAALGKEAIFSVWRSYERKLDAYQGSVGAEVSYVIVPFFDGFQVHLKFPACSWRYCEWKGDFLTCFLLEHDESKSKIAASSFEPHIVQCPVNTFSNIQLSVAAIKKDKTKFPVTPSRPLLPLPFHLAVIFSPPAFITISYLHYSERNAEKSPSPTPPPPTSWSMSVKESKPWGINQAPPPPHHSPQLHVNSFQCSCILSKSFFGISQLVGCGPKVGSQSCFYWTVLVFFYFKRGMWRDAYE